MLPNAYANFEYGKDKIPSLEESILIQKTKTEFYEKMCNFQQNILKKANERNNRATIENALDCMEKAWEMIDKFKDLVKPVDFPIPKERKNC